MSTSFWTIPASADGATLAGAVREHTGQSWKTAKRLVATGKVFVAGQRVDRVEHRVRAGDEVEVRMTAPRPRPPGSDARLVFDDAHVVVLDKPAGISSVPYDPRERGTAMDLIRDIWRRQGKAATDSALHVVHRIDKDTSGLLAFARTRHAERSLQAQLREHTMARTYLCVVHGAVRSGRIASLLVGDRGDGLRGSARFANQGGKRAVTHVEVVEELAAATLCRVRLETGKTHQIRIHLAERWGPLVGERVYIRDWEGKGNPLLPSPRLLLHATTLAFTHPATGELVECRAEPPQDFTSVVDHLRRG
jgi:23S rRNA pseudouridine1911/1915/1917 synthase